MAKNNEGEAQQGGFFGRMFGNRGKSPIKAKMGEQNAFVYDEKLKRWIIPGEKIEESAIASAPPPMSRAASATSMSESEGPDGHRRTGSTDSSKRGGAAARYANPGFLATSRTASEQSASAASIIPSPAKPPLIPTAKASVFVPGKPEGAATASGPRFFVPGGSATTQAASSRFANFGSKARQVAPEEATAEQPAPADEVLSPNKRAKVDAPDQQGVVESMESELTLAKGMGAPASDPLPAPVISSAAAEESVGENTFNGDAGASDGAITSPGPKEAADASWGMRGSTAVDRSVAEVDPEGGAGGEYTQSVQYGGHFGLGKGDGSYAQPSDQAQDYFGADAAAAAQVDGGSAPKAAYTGAEAEQGSGEATWEQVQEWANYYRTEGYSEEDVQTWIASNYPQFAQQPAFQDPSQQPQGAGQPTEMYAVQQKLPGTEQQQYGEAEASEEYPVAIGQEGAPTDARGSADGGQLHGSFPEAAVEAEGVLQETAFQHRSRVQSEAYSDVADWGSSRGHLDDVSTSGMGGEQGTSQAPSQGRFGRLASESSASGKLSGPLPWDVLDDRSDEENSTAGTPRFELAFSNGEAGNSARPALAGAAFAEAAEQAGSKLTGWVTGLVRQGVQSHLAANARFPRAPLDIRNAPSSPSASLRSGTTSIRAHQGTPTSVKSVEGQHGDSSLPPSAKAARYGRGAFDNESVLSETIVEEEADHHDTHGHPNHTAPPPDFTHPPEAAHPHHAPASQEQEAAAAGVDAWAGEDLGNHTADQDGWDFDAGAQDDLPPASQAPREASSEQPPLSAAEDARGGAADGKNQIEDRKLPHTWAGDLPHPNAANQADFGFDRSAPIPTAVSGNAADALSGVGTNGGGSVMGESPQAGWEGESELGFPLDDVPKDVGAPSAKVTPLDLPEGAALTPLKVPPLSPLRTVSGGAASARPASAAAAAVKEAFAHGDEAAQLAALQERLEEVIALQQHASDENETLRDQNGALELELADLKTQLDADVAEARQAQDVLARSRHLEEQLEDVWQEVEQLRVKNDALKADNATLLAERAADAGGAAAAHSNGDLKARAADDGAEAPFAAAAAELEAARQRIIDLEEILLEQGGGAEEIASLEKQVEELMAESEALAEEGLAKDVEIEALEGRLAAANSALTAAQQGASEELVTLRKEAAAANAEVVSLGDALDAMGQESEQLKEELAARDAELERVRAELAAKAEDAQLLEDLQSQVAAREAEIARLQGELSSKEEELGQISKEAAAKETIEKKLRSALKHAKEVAAKERTELMAQLQAAQQAASDAQAQTQRLTEDLSQLQEGKAAAEQLCRQAEAEVKALKENQALDFERIGKLSDENAALQERIDELEAAGTSGASAEAAAEAARLRDELAAAAARADEAEARAKTLAQEKETFGKRGAKLQAKLNRLQTEFQEKQAALAKELEEARAAAAAAEKVAAEAEAARAALAEAVQQEKDRASQGEQGLKAEASALAAQVAELQAAVGAESQRRQEAEQQLALAAQEAVNAAAAKHALSEELAAEKTKVAELEEEATALFDKVSAAEDEAGAAEARAHALADQLHAAQASLQATAQPGDGAGAAAAAEEELELARAAAAEQEREFGDLLACLGQESAKVAALQELLAQKGIDPSGVLAQVEADYGFGDEMGDGEEEEEEAEQDPMAEAPSQETPSEQTQAGPSAAEDAPADVAWPGFSAAAGAEGTQEQPSAVQRAQHAQQSSIEGLPEGELLSPDKGLPRLGEQLKSEIAAGINFGAQPTAGGQEVDFDGWGADAEGDWGFS